MRSLWKDVLWWLWFCFATSCDWLKHHTSLSQPIKRKTQEPIVTSSYAFFRARCQRRVFALSYDCCTRLYVVTGQNNCLALSFRQSALNNKWQKSTEKNAIKACWLRTEFLAKFVATSWQPLRLVGAFIISRNLGRNSNEALRSILTFSRKNVPFHCLHVIEMLIA